MKSVICAEILNHMPVEKNTHIVRAFSIKLLLGIATLACILSCSRVQETTLPFNSTNPVVIDNDGNIDVYTLEFVAALASAGNINLVGIIGDAHYQDYVDMARRSGMRNLPDAVLGTVTGALSRPASGNIEDTIPLDSPGARLIVTQAHALGTTARPLLVVTGGHLTTVASAYLLDPAIVDRVIPVAVAGRADKMDLGGYNCAIDGWACYIVLQKFASVFVLPTDLYHPEIAKGRLLQDLPDREIRRAMFDKEFAVNDLPGDRDADAVAVLPVIDPAIGPGHYITSTKRVSFDGWAPSHYPDWFPTSHDFVPKLKEDADGDDILTTGWDAEIATRLWWNAMINSDAWQGSFHQQSPYNGVAQDLQGRIQAENFDYGGQGFAYNDSEFNSWRDTDLRTLEKVDLERGGSGQVVGYLRDGEWIEHTVNAPVAGYYTIRARVSSTSDNGKIAVEFRDPATDTVMASTPEITVDSTGGYDNYQDLSLPGVTLNPGNYVMRTRFRSPVYRYEVEDLEYSTSPGDRIQLVNDSIASGRKWHLLNANHPSDYVQYTINVPRTGTYAVTMRFRESGTNKKLLSYIFPRRLINKILPGYLEGMGAAGIKIDDDAVKGVVNQYAPGNYVAWRTGYFRTKTFTSAGNKLFRVIPVTRSTNSNNYNLSMDYIELVEEGPFKLDYLEFTAPGNSAEPVLN
ncbi:MAG: carbohydrate-binding protein [Gammaproteobacteria bacterium]